MYHKTEGIVLSVAKYNDKYAIVQVFTRDFGRLSYLLPKTGGKRSKTRNALFSPLSVLKLETEHLPLREIQRLKEVEMLFPLYDLSTNVNKLSIAFFLSEFLSRVLRETNDNNALLYSYIHYSVQVLENADKGLANYHLAFLFGLTRFLGISPNLDDYFSGAYFDLLNGEFVCQTPLHSYFVLPEECAYLSSFRRINYRNMHLFKLSRSQRNALVEQMLTYYRLHVYDFPALKSLDVLREIAK